jgi:hypothetical protein
MSSTGPLLIDCGDLPSLVAVTLEARPQRLVLYHAQETGPAADRRLAAAREHGSVFGVRETVVEKLPPPDAGSGPEGLAQAWLLLGAAAAARRHACSRVIWPHQVGPDADAVGLVMERASLVSALVEVAGGTGADLVIDLPLADLTEAQLADLAEDAGAPMHAFWPCDAGGDLPCETCAGCRRWRAAFDEAGVVWPWLAVSA